MRRIKHFVLPFLISVSMAAGCGHAATRETVNDSASSRIIPLPSDNSSATNPSLADTAYPLKDTTKMQKDSSGRK